MWPKDQNFVKRNQMNPLTRTEILAIEQRGLNLQSIKSNELNSSK